MRTTFSFFIFALVGLIVGSVLGGGISLRLRYDDVRDEVEKEKERLMSEWELKEIAVTDYELAAGEVLEPEYISIRKFPAQFVSPSFLTPEEAQALAGNQVAMSIAVGDPLTRQLIVGEDAGISCAAGKTAEAWVARRFLPAGTKVSALDFQRTAIPLSLFTFSVVTSIEDEEGEELTHPLEEGDLLMHPNLAPCECSLDGGFAEDEP